MREPRGEVCLVQVMLLLRVHVLEQGGTVEINQITCSPNEITRIHLKYRG